MNTAPTPAAVIDGAVAEAGRRQLISERDLAPEVQHFSATVGAVCRDWQLTARGWFEGGAGMPTLDVVRADGTAGVLKVSRPGGLDAAARVMVAAGGRGYAEVMAWDPVRGALLTERLGDDLCTEETGIVRQSSLVVPLLLDAWRVPLECGDPFRGKALGLLAILAELGPRYGSAHDEAVPLATSYARELAATERPEVVCHGDPHGGNVLRRRTGWALIDPDGFVGERAYDLGVVLRDACRELVAAEGAASGSGTTLLRDGCAHLAELASVDAERVWRWGFVERVTTGLYLAWHGHADEAQAFLDTATVLAGHS